VGHYFFPKDLAESKIAVNLMMARYKELGFEVAELVKSQQIYGDFQSANGLSVVNHEVKYDIMAGKTRNLCFEIANAKGALTGIAKTQADFVHYVVPNSDKTEFTAYTFELAKLKEYLFDTANTKKIRQVQGGDGKKFSMLIVSIDNIVADEVADSVEVLSAKLSL
jgi:hypothetical protein